MFAVVVAALGIANTLALSIVERTRELGLLRAIGMDRRSMRRMIRIEGVMLAIFGGILGVGLGIAFGAAAVQILPANTAILSFPTLRLVYLFAAACVLGFLASILPARRAGKLQILDATAWTEILEPVERWARLHVPAGCRGLFADESRSRRCRRPALSSQRLILVVGLPGLEPGTFGPPDLSKHFSDLRRSAEYSL